jgi:[protein-PII] uridylyltransferase
LLYDVTRTLFDLGLSVSSAKISTRLDQVVDVFYVEDKQSGKLEQPGRLEIVRQRLLSVIQSPP